MDRDDGVELLDDHSISALAFRAVSGYALDQPIELARAMSLSSRYRGSSISGNIRSAAPASVIAHSKITTPALFDSGVDLPHRCIVATSFDVMRAADLPVPCTGCRAIIEADVVRHS
jgi:hypothetical protein